ncbi:MAG: RICIN domain-containing protein [Fibrobacteraceae bacterium]|nr:RICIN domain-containing protein [Fibrobacteraceae bacterium]
MDSAVKIYNTYASLTKHINVYYSTGVPTAEASSNGDLRFGKERSYMFVGTAMHEMAHTLGMGTTQDYKNMLKDGVFQGEKAQAKLKELTGDNSQVLKGDAQHFWPYGLNYASEVKSEQDLIFHAQIVEAMYQDIFKEAFYMDGRIKSVATGKCIGMESDNSLKLMDCKDEGTVAKLFSIGEPVSYRIQYGTRVIDVPNESTAAGVTLSTYGWNGGAHQKYFMETTGENGHFYLRNAKSGHYIQAVSDHLEQNPSDKGESFLWVILDGSVKDSTDEEPPSAITKKWGRAPYFINSDGWGVDVKGRGQKKAKYRVIF